MITGGCLCGGIRYEYDGEIDEISLCHCSQCRKAQGSAYVAVCPVDATRFRLLSGQALLKEFRAVPHKAWVFCANAYHIHVASRAVWETLADALPQHAQGKPDTRAEAERLYAALSAGGAVEMPLQDMFWGAYFASFSDRYGLRWMINCVGR